MTTVVFGSTLPQIRQALLDLFGSELGTYTLPDGTTIPALYVAKPGQVRPEWRVTGIECVLGRTPLLRSLGGVGAQVANRIWTLTFRAFDTTQTLDTIQLIAFRAWPRLQPRHLPQTDTTYEQLTYELPDPVLITPF